MIMHLRNMLFAAGWVFLTASFFSCEQKVNKIDDKPTTLRNPLSVKDSGILSLDRSPMDMSYFPEDYPKQKMLTPGMPNPVARVIYSRPQKNGRTLFADTTVKLNVIQHYGQEWRLGANEATEIEFYREVSIGGKKIPAGRYIMYCIPYPDRWKVILNENLYSWGLHMDRTKDLAEVELPVIRNNVMIEYFTMLFQNSTYGCELVMAWGDVKVVMPVNFN
jgi:Protein of unknown function (DUF2911)